MKPLKLALLIIVLISTTLLVYSPHFSNPYPAHMDEWHHITEAIHLKNGDYKLGSGALEIGFHAFLAFFLFFITPGKLVLIYKFFPAIWACLSALALFILVYRKTEKNFWISLLAIIFFASIKSNSNTGGLWFFTPLTFAIPFIFMYILLFTEGLEKQNKKLILSSLGIMLLLIFTHSISVLFAIPILLIYSLFYLPYIKKEWKFFSLFLLIPIMGLLFYKIVRSLEFSLVLKKIINALQFKHGWGVLEVTISPLFIYSLIGFVLAILSLLYIYTHRKKQYLLFVIWPILTLISIIIYLITGTSYLVPYQRNITYFILAIPFLSALGLYYILKLAIPIIETLIKNMQLGPKEGKILKILGIIIICGIFLGLAFISYYKLPENITPKPIIDSMDYDSIKFLSKFNTTTIMANAMISEAIFPITGHNPVGTLFFYGNRSATEMFYASKNCTEKNKLLKKHKVEFVIARSPQNCTWTKIYSRRNYIYQMD